jgi:transcriptional regulator with XRE-family HTH domain
MSKQLEKQIQEQRESLSANILKLRSKNQLSQQALANLAGVDRKTVNRIECGHFSPSLDTLVRLGEAFKITTAKLLG